MGLVIAGERSGVGKTTVTLALLAFLAKQGLRVQSFKVGPDYIDPMFHRYVTGRACRNLDPMLTSEDYVQQCFAKHTHTADYALVEGVMGLFDGAASSSYQTDRGDRPGNFASTAHIAKLLNLPVVLVVDCSRLSHSIAALVSGYRWFDPEIEFAGVVLNRVGSDRHLELLQSALDSIDMPVLGVLHRQDNIAIPDRHLGLVPTAELNHLDAVVDRLADIGETCFNRSRLLQLLKAPPAKEKQVEQAPNVDSRYEQRGAELEFPPPLPPQINVRLAVAQDSAFSFYYQDNLDLLEELGAELIFWSPMHDSALPEGVQGLYFGGGFPEVFAESLAANEPMRRSIRTVIQAGMPTYAECGGLMYLCEGITTFEGQTFPMVGVLPTTAVMGARLTLGYRKAIAQQTTPLISQGQAVYGHEFHRSSLTHTPENPLFEIWQPGAALKRSTSRQDNPAPHSEGWHLPNLHASYLHLHWGDRPESPKQFLQHCQQFALLAEQPA